MCALMMVYTFPSTYINLHPLVSVYSYPHVPIFFCLCLSLTFYPSEFIFVYSFLAVLSTYLPISVYICLST